MKRNRTIEQQDDAILAFLATVEAKAKALPSVIEAKDEVGNNILNVTGWTDSKALPARIEKNGKRYWLSNYTDTVAIYIAEG